MNIWPISQKTNSWSGNGRCSDNSEKSMLSEEYNCKKPHHSSLWTVAWKLFPIYNLFYDVRGISFRLVKRYPIQRKRNFPFFCVRVSIFFSWNTIVVQNNDAIFDQRNYYYQTKIQIIRNEDQNNVTNHNYHMVSIFNRTACWESVRLLGEFGLF